MEMLFMVLGGLGLFLYGIKLMSSGLQTIAGDRMRIILEKGTKTPIRGVLTGIIVTGLIQSSSGTTVLTVGLVNSGLLTLRQAIGVIMGANIGTTVTAYLIGFKLADYALPIVFVGVLLLCFSKNQKISTIGQSILGFGLLFYGMDIMGNGLQPLAHTQLFNDLMAQVDDNPLVGVGIGAGLTAVVQSSAATIGILQELAYQHVITYSQAVPILFGDNIGTTVTALIAGIGASVAARRASLTHFIFNVIGTLIFLPLFLLGIFPWLVENVTNILFFAAGGWDVEECAVFAQAVAQGGAAYIHVSGGGLTPDQRIALAPGYQVGLAARIKAAVPGLPVIAVGLITEAELASSIVGTGQADMVGIGRAMLYDPRWPWHAAAALGLTIPGAPRPYLRSKPHNVKELFAD